MLNMVEKQLTTLKYAAGASLATIALVYVFAPTFILDGEAESSSASTRKRSIVGLTNPANDCFINSVLQALAGLGDLRIYLIQEIHRRRLGGDAIYSQLVIDPARKNLPEWKLEGLQYGIVTQGLKDVLDALNERPIYKKAISAAPFVRVLETAFKQRISRQQQDAQEFLQVVAERLCDEYHAGHRARNHGEKKAEIQEEEALKLQLSQMTVGNGGTTIPAPAISASNGALQSGDNENEGEKDTNIHIPETEQGFPLEGGSESQIECLSCGFKPRPTTTTFCSLTLSVPQVSSTSLSSCFDQMFKTEYIEDFKCEKCRLVNALELLEQDMTTSTSEQFRAKGEIAIEALKKAIATNPEEELKDIELPDSKFAPKRKIARHVRVTKFPKVLAIHLSRSIFDAGRTTMKNSAKVVFPERLPMGGLLNQKFYRLSSVVCHKGSHHSGHYETFRRQSVTPPYLNRDPFTPAPIYSKPSTPVPSQISTPRTIPETNGDNGTLSSTPELLSPTSAASSSRSFTNTNGMESSLDSSSHANRTFTMSTKTADTTARGPTSAPVDASDSNSIRSVARSARESLSNTIFRRGSKTSSSPTSPTKEAEGKRKRAKTNRWWRISDEKIKECKTGDVLGMQREVYLLFYEIEKED